MLRQKKLATVSTLLALALLALLPTPAAAGKGWKFLGERTVTDRLDHDSIAVTVAAGDFTALQIRVKGVAVQFHSVKIRFGNGETQEVALREVIRAGGASRVIDVAGGDRVIRSVEFWYDSQSVRGRPALVRLFGRR
jgi:hypothetical protein